jgi:polysaccharide pyruvyl transferase WcaK-like protein
MLRGICFDDLILLAKKSRAVYSMRYHGLVAAKIAGVDFIGVGNDEKLTEYCLEQGAEMLQEE